MQGQESIFRWMWRSYARAALLPLVLVEGALIAAYLITNNIIADANISALQRESSQRLQQMIIDQGAVIEARILGVMDHARILRDATAHALANEHDPGADERDRYAFSADGVYHTTVDNGGAALFYSGRTAIGEQERQKAWRTAQVDPVMRWIRDSSPLVMQVYLNTHDSMNRIYPYFDVATQYPPQMDIPTYNFYYEADAAHNPERRVVWTDVYLDPAGQGWMASCIAPVYQGDFLAAVVGLDVTVETFVRSVLSLDIPWGGYAMLVDRQGGIMAMPPAAEADLGLAELTSHQYGAAIARQELKPETYRLANQPALRELVQRMESAGTGHGVAHISLGGDRLAAWSRIPATGWTLLAFVPEENIYAESSTLAARFYRLGLQMIAALVLFYLLFFAYLYWRARRMATLIGVPLREFARMAGDIGRGNYTQRPIETAVQEIGEAARELVHMGERLGESNQALVAARDAAEVASLAKGEFISTMSHEIRTPLNSIIGMASLMELSRQDPKERQYLHVIQDSSEQLLALVNDLLDLSRLESGGYRNQSTVFDTRLLATRAFRTVRGLPKAAALALELHVDERVPEYLEGDAAGLSQILVNLLGNAVKFTEQGSVALEVLAGPAEQGIVEARFSVRDTGPGIPAEWQDRVFDPFVQVVRDRLRPHEGTGLGLAIARRLAHTMGGRLEISGEEGRGTTFTLVVPMQVARAPAGKQASPAPVPSLRPLRILVAEDMGIAQAVIRGILMKLGHEVRIVGDGRAAVDAFREEPFDVVFMDIQMPVMDGLEAARCIRAIGTPASRDVPIVGLSAFAQESYRQNAFAAGMTSYLTKPIRYADIRDLLLEIQGAAPAADALRTVAQAGAGAGDDPAIRAALMDLGDTLGAGALAQLLECLEKDVDLVVAELRAATAAQDAGKVAASAHRLKGLFAQFGMESVAALAARVESECRASGRADALHLDTLALESVRRLRTIAGR